MPGAGAAEGLGPAGSGTSRTLPSSVDLQAHGASSTCCCERVSSNPHSWPGPRGCAQRFRSAADRRRFAVSAWKIAARQVRAQSIRPPSVRLRATMTRRGHQLRVREVESSRLQPVKAAAVLTTLAPNAVEVGAVEACAACRFDRSKATAHRPVALMSAKERSACSSASAKRDLYAGMAVRIGEIAADEARLAQVGVGEAAADAGSWENRAFCRMTAESWTSVSTQSVKTATGPPWAKSAFDRSRPA